MQTVQEDRGLALVMETISLEAGVLSNMVDSVRRLFPDLLSGLTGSLNKAKDLPEVTVSHTSLQKEVLQKVATVPFLELDKVELNVPEGFKADYLTALSTVSQAVKFMRNVNDSVVKDYRVYLSAFVSNKDVKISLKDSSQTLKELRVARKQINDQFAELYKANSYDSKLPYTTLVHRNADLESVFVSMNSNSSAIKNLDIVSLKDQVSTITQLLETIITQAKESKITAISPEAVKNLSDGAFEIALQVETYSACYYRSIAILHSVDAMTEQLNKHLSN